ncbi:MAG: ImmA/IrrE family metallo-endopeptidase [Phycisphaerales bacterium]
MSTPALQLWPLMRRVEKAAWNAIVKCARAKKLSALPLPIPVEQWVEGPLGIQLSIADLTHLGPGVLGMARPSDREIQVSDTLLSYEPRLRFTIAHELGHVLLHERLSTDFRDSADADFMERKIEREADRFAASFLMPLPALSSELASVATTLWSDPQSLLLAVSRGDVPAERVFRSTVLPHLTRRFNVSLSATVRRFNDIQLPTGERALPLAVGVKFLPVDQVREATQRE